MSEENTTTTSGTVSTISSTSARNSSGVLGTGTPSSRLKSRWRKANSHLSFKQYMRSQSKSGDADAKAVIANKRGAANADRSEKNKERVAKEKSATRLSKKGKSS
jgi:hypothetical protein